jgi:hypothetical protein
MPEHAREEDAIPDLSQYCEVGAAAGSTGEFGCGWFSRMSGSG